MNVEKILLENSASPSRREFLKTSGMLVVGFSAAAVAGPFAAQAASASSTARGNCSGALMWPPSRRPCPLAPRA